MQATGEGAPNRNVKEEQCCEDRKTAGAATPNELALETGGQKGAVWSAEQREEHHPVGDLEPQPATSLAVCLAVTETIVLVL